MLGKGVLVKSCASKEHATSVSDSSDSETDPVSDFVVDAIGSHNDASVRISEAVTKVGNDKSPIKELSHNDGRMRIEG